jgi:hypothetical protein
VVLREGVEACSLFLPLPFSPSLPLSPLTVDGLKVGEQQAAEEQLLAHSGPHREQQRGHRGLGQVRSAAQQAQGEDPRVPRQLHEGSRKAIQHPSEAWHHFHEQRDTAFAL